MTYIAPAIQAKFDTLSVGLQNMILERDTKLDTMQDLIHVLEDIVKEAESDDN